MTTREEKNQRRMTRIMKMQNPRMMTGTEKVEHRLTTIARSLKSNLKMKAQQEMCND